MENQKAPNLCPGHLRFAPQRAIDPLDFALDEVVHFSPAADQLLV